MYTDQDSARFFKKISETFASIDLINKLIKGVENLETSFRANKTSANADKLIRGVETLEAKYESSLTNVSQLIDMIDNMIKKSSPANDSIATSLPSPESVNDMVKNFFMEKIKTRPSPTPIFAGCYAYKNKNPKPNSFICARYNDFFPLMITLAYDQQTRILTLINATDVEVNGVQPIQLTSLDDWTPLPTIIPDKPIGRWEHSKNSEILSLYKQNERDDSWTNRFFKATVIKRPCDKSQEPGERGYLLDFGENIQQNVPEQFVVNLPESWKPVSEKAILKNYLNS